MFISHKSGGWKPKIKVLADLESGEEGWIPGYMVEEVKELSGISLIRTPSSVVKTLPS